LIVRTRRISLFNLITLQGAIVALCTNPFWVVKVRMCASRKGQAGAYSGLFGECFDLQMFSNTECCSQTPSRYFRRIVSDCSIRRGTRALQRYYSRSVQCFTWRTAVHGIWRDEKMAITNKSRERSESFGEFSVNICYRHSLDIFLDVYWFALLFTIV
jgi:hypothetical protein